MKKLSLGYYWNICSCLHLPGNDFSLYRIDFRCASNRVSFVSKRVLLKRLVSEYLFSKKELTSNILKSPSPDCTKTLKSSKCDKEHARCWNCNITRAAALGAIFYGVHCFAAFVLKTDKENVLVVFISS